MDHKTPENNTKEIIDRIRRYEVEIKVHEKQIKAIKEAIGELRQFLPSVWFIERASTGQIKSPVFDSLDKLIEWCIAKGYYPEQGRNDWNNIKDLYQVVDSLTGDWKNRYIGNIRHIDLLNDRYEELTSA